jgi:molybdopterin-guanine dinucleotide biosynthesis protein A
MKRLREGKGMSFADTAVILCGGKSQRAGFDKQLLPADGTTLPRAIARRLETLFREIIIVTGRPDLYADTSYVVVEDIVKDAGPLAGIFTALRHSTSDHVYVTAGDMPQTNLAYIAWMMRLLEAGPLDALATRNGENHIEPFNSFFSARCAPEIGAMLAKGSRSVGLFLRSREYAHFVPEEDARIFSPDWGMFWNINTSADVQRYLAWCTARGAAGMLSRDETCSDSGRGVGDAAVAHEQEPGSQTAPPPHEGEKPPRPRVPETGRAGAAGAALGLRR